MSAPPRNAKLPGLSPTEEDWLWDELGHFVERCGARPLVASHLIEADPQCFPEPWRGGPASVARTLWRWLRYADMPNVAIEVRIFDDAASGEPCFRPEPYRGQVLAAWLIASGKSKLEIGVERSALADPLVCIPALGRAVAHAFCIAHGFCRSPTDVWSASIDVATVFLGFGVVTTQASLRFGNAAGNRSPARLGRLPSQAMSFLLAIVACARGLDGKRRRQVAQRLPAQQRSDFYAALDGIDRQIAAGQLDVHARLHLGPPETWPKPVEWTLLAANAPPQEGIFVAAEDEPKAGEIGVAGMNRDRKVFCVERRLSARMFKFSFGLVFAIGMLAQGFKCEIDRASYSVFGLAAVVSLTALAAFVRERRCSEPKCDARLRRGQTICTRCGGTVAGTIRSAKERLAAEEALRT